VRKEDIMMDPHAMTDEPHSRHGGHGGRRGPGHGGRGSRSGGPPPWARGSQDTPFGAFGPVLRGPRGRAGRGEVRAAVLTLLAEQPRHGYEIISEIVERSEGRWQPSPGSIYPVLKRLAAEGMVRAEPDGDRRVFDLTDDGRAYVDTHAQTLGEPWSDMGAGQSASTASLLDAAGQVAAALGQVAQAGTEEQQAAATAVLLQTKRSLYRVLADDAPEGPSDAGGPSGQ
jgi:DNA-binding PadR family transcriptional regulator